MARLSDLLISGLDFGNNDIVDARPLGNSDDEIRLHRGNDIAFGGRGDDVFIDGGTDGDGNRDTGFDSMFGGRGADTFHVADTNNFIDGGRGIDTVSFAGYSHSGVHPIDSNQGVFVDLANTDQFENVENLVGSRFDDTLKGNELDNTISGGRGSDTLEGKAGNDNLNGGRGADTLIGGAGQDTLTGGSGADVFRFGALSESRVGSADVITDFAAGTDRIDLSAIDANGILQGNGEFRFIGAAEFGGANGLALPGSLRAYYDAETNQTVVQANTDFDGAAEMEIRLDGNVTLTAADFVL